MGIIRIIFRLGLLGSGLFLATLLAVIFWTYADIWPSEQDLSSTDFVVCLGGGMFTSEPEIKPGSKQRAATCARLFLAGNTKSIVFTGSGPATHELSVADLMAQHAMELGVPETAVFIEPDARSTLQNALFSLPKIADGSTVRIVTDSFHLPRSWLSFRWAGYPDVQVYPSQAKVNRDITWKNFQPFFRESLAIWFNLARLPVYSAAKAIQVSNADRILH